MALLDEPPQMAPPHRNNIEEAMTILWNEIHRLYGPIHKKWLDQEFFEEVIDYGG